MLDKICDAATQKQPIGAVLSLPVNSNWFQLVLRVYIGIHRIFSQSAIFTVKLHKIYAVIVSVKYRWMDFRICNLNPIKTGSTQGIHQLQRYESYPSVYAIVYRLHVLPQILLFMSDTYTRFLDDANRAVYKFWSHLKNFQFAKRWMICGGGVKLKKLQHRYFPPFAHVRNV